MKNQLSSYVRSYFIYKGIGMMYAWLTLAPPFITLACALLTKRVGPSLLLGIFATCLILFNFSIPYAIGFASARIWANSQLGHLFTWSGNFDTLYTFGFLFLIGIIVALINHTGGAQAYANKVRNYLTDKRSVETSSLLLSLGLFVDDYLNCLTVGCAMRPLTDKFGIPRAKLAYLIDSMAVPWIIVVPVSSWVAVICNMLQKAGISESSPVAFVIADPFYAYIRIIPYIFYSLLTIASVWIIVRMRLSFGPMQKHERIAQETGNLLGGGEPPIIERSECCAQNSSIVEFILPIASLLSLFTLGLLYSGEFVLFGGNNSLFQAVQKANYFTVMFWSSLASLVIGLSYSWYQRTVTLTSLRPIVTNGLHLMAYSNLVLLLAWTFSDLLKNYLHTGEYIAYLVSGAVSLKLLPFIFYLITTSISIALGSSWATMMIIIPLAVPMVIAYTAIAPPLTLATVPILLPTLGAILSGAATGDHISPIACTTIMAATSSGASLIDHIKTQLVYSVPAICATAIAFLVAGLTITLNPITNFLLSISAGIIVLCIMLFILQWYWNSVKKA